MKSIRIKMIYAILFTSCILFGVNVILFRNINGTIKEIDQIYASNTSLNELASMLDEVHENMFRYLNTKNSNALENYYKYEQEYLFLLETLNDKVSDNPNKSMERTIRKLSESYLEYTSMTVQAKRGRIIEKYKLSYEKSDELYNYIKTYIYLLNNQQFKINSSNYEILIASLKDLEIITFTVLIAVTILNIAILSMMMRSITNPLIQLVNVANEISRGNLKVKLAEPVVLDEVGIVTKAFNTMVTSINTYIERLRERMEYESELKEKELQMEGLLKDAQLKYLHAQINPHFLFNTLNAGAQLAMMEDAEKTCLFIENMAAFFRYNVQKLDKEASLQEEIAVIDNYIHILKVRFGDEVEFEKNIQCDCLNEIKIPSMVLQPIIENAFNHGIRNLEWQGKIILTIEEQKDSILISIKDNGRGMEEETIQKINSQIPIKEEAMAGTGIGLNNVINRLELYFTKKEIVLVKSEGKNKGSEILINIPKIK